VSIFPTPEHVWALGIDAADRALGTLSTAVVVLDRVPPDASEASGLGGKAARSAAVGGHLDWVHNQS